MTDMTCKTRELVYVLICKSCKHEKIGDTGVKLNEHINLHRIQRGILAPSKHIHECEQRTIRGFPFLSAVNSAIFFVGKWNLNLQKK